MAFGQDAELGRSIGVRLAAYVPGTWIPMIIGLLSIAVFTRALTTEDFGRYSLVLSGSSLVVVVLSMWLQQGVSRYLSEAISDAEAARAKDELVHGLVVVGLMVFVLIPTASVLLLIGGGPWVVYMLPAAFWVGAQSLSAPVLAVLPAEMNAGSYSVYRTTVRSLAFLINLTIVFFVWRNAAALFWGNFFATLLMGPYLVRHAGLRLRMPTLRRGAFRPKLYRFAVYGVPMVGWFSTALFLEVGDRWVIAAFRGAQEVGIYSANYQLIAAAAALVATPVALTLYPRMMRSWARGDSEETSLLVGRVIEWWLLAGISLIAGTVLFSRDLASWFLGSAFREGHIIMPAVVAGVLAWQVGMYAQKPLEFVARTKLMLRWGLLSAGLNLILNLALVPSLGYVAAAYTTVASFAVYTISVGLEGLKVLGWRVSWSRVAFEGSILAVGFSLAGALRAILQESLGGWLSVLLALGIISLTMGALLARRVLADREKMGQ